MKILCSKIRSTTKILSLSLIAIVLAVVTFVTGSGSVYFGYCYRIVPIYSVETNEKKVALTFDAAWGSDKTLKIVDTLTNAGVKGTFFLVGFWVEEYPEMVKALSDANIEIGTHSNTHADFANLKESEIKLELETSVNLIKNITGKQVGLFRAPYGSYNNTVLSTAESIGLTTIQWDVDTLDWKGLATNEICERVSNKVKNGSIILCHNNSEHILDALPVMLTMLKNKGYEITSVGDLIYKENYYVDNLGIQRQK